MSDLRISDVVRLAGLGAETIRYYERRGLVRPSRRTRRGTRRYDMDVVRRLRFIKRTQRLGFSLDAVGALLRLSDDHDAPCAEVLARADAKLAEVAAAQRELAATHATLRRLVGACRRRKDPRRCPMLETLFGDADPFEE
ncbi:MAG TPA: MerR family DNA-binding protein [Candidatus Binatia bacterium]|nr:MerR family DNA-binding protein [Candidatus Binatia bacterium]